jgi:hypothetical protein
LTDGGFVVITHSKIRVLGAAGASSDMLPILAGESEFAKLTLYQDSLPAQARVFYQGVNRQSPRHLIHGQIDILANHRLKAITRAGCEAFCGRREFQLCDGAEFSTT